MASGRFTRTVIDAESDFGNFIAYSNESGKSNAVTLFANSLSTSSNQVVSVVVGVATTALGLALILRINKEFGTIEENEIALKNSKENLK